MQTNLRVGPIALALMHHFEERRLTAYRCPADVPTIGWGNTYYLDGSRVRMGDRITAEHADALYTAILERDFAAPVRAAIGDAPTTPAQFGAMVSLAYNIGMGPRLWVPGRKKGFRQSEVLRLHLAGNYAGAAEAFAGWTRAGGQVSDGLVRRRKAEAALYRSDFADLAKHTYGKVRP